MHRCYLSLEVKIKLFQRGWEFAERNHLVFCQPSWKEDADFILYWLHELR
jgi:hypothetical protein